MKIYEILTESTSRDTKRSLQAELADVYNRMAPDIEKYKDSFLAGQLYDALEAVAEQHGAEAEFKRMMNGARNRAHMEYDTNPGGFHNWFWFLPFADDKNEAVAERYDDGKQDNFTIVDIKRLEQIRDFETLKSQAKELIKGKPARRMKPEKIRFFYDRIDTLKNPMAVIKMMYDLMLAGEGNKVIGSSNSMSSNSYRQRFGEQGVSEAKSIMKRVRIVKGSETGKTGTVGEVRHGAFKGAAKTYTVDLDDGGSIQLPKEALRLIPQANVTEGELMKGAMKEYERRVAALEKKGLTRSDAQGVVDAQVMNKSKNKTREPATAEGLTLDQQFDIIEDMVEQLAQAHGVDAEAIWEDFESVDDTELFETAAWRRSAGKSKSGGLNAKGVASYRRENPGSKLQTAVTTKPSKLKKGSKAAKRRKSFCARMGGVKGPMKKPNGKPTRKALALRKWNC